MRRVGWIAVALTCAVVGCKNVDDWLNDLATLDPTPTRPSFERQTVIFDSGQLGHEALTGLATAEEMTLWQALRALYHASNNLGRARDNALLQADGAVLIERITTRLPIPAVDRPLSDERDVTAVGFEQITEIIQARELITPPDYFPALEAPDAAQREDALDALRELTGQDFGYETAAWEAWWDGIRAERGAEYVRRSGPPLEILGNLRFTSASDARTVLQVFAILLQGLITPELEPVAIPNALRVARQTAVLSLNEALRTAEAPQVRSDVAHAMGAIRDPAFGPVLADQLRRETDPYAAARMAAALVHYPGRSTIQALFVGMAGHDLQVDWHAADTLREITGQDFGDDLDAWAGWWADEGRLTWP